MALFPYTDTQSAKVQAEWEPADSGIQWLYPLGGYGEPIPRCSCLPRCLSCSVSPLHGLAKLEEATEALAHGIERDQLSETPIKAASGSHWRRDAAVGMEKASEGLRTSRDVVKKTDSPFQAQKGCWEL